VALEGELVGAVAFNAISRSVFSQWDNRSFDSPRVILVSSTRSRENVSREHSFYFVSFPTVNLNRSDRESLFFVIKSVNCGRFMAI